MGTGSFPGDQRPGRGVDHQPPSSAEVKERVELYFYSPSGPLWPVLGRTVPLPLLTHVVPACTEYEDQDLVSSSKTPSLLTYVTTWMKKMRE
jgi:hypothetical protein